MTETTDPPTGGTPSPSLIIFTLDRVGTNVGYFHASAAESYVENTPCFPASFRPGRLYCLRRSSTGRGIFCELEEKAKNAYLDRGSCNFLDTGYDGSVLRSLLLGSRIADYQRRAAIVVSLSSESLALSMPLLLGDVDVAQFRTESGAIMEVEIEDVIRSNRSMQVYCTPVQEVPRGLHKNSALEIVSCNHLPIQIKPSLVTRILEDYYLRRRLVADYTFFSYVYGSPGSFDNRKIDETIVTLQDRQRRRLHLAPDQSQAVEEYLEDSGCPGMALVGGPGTGKKLTATAMAAIYCAHHEGCQVIISPSKEALREVAVILAELELGCKRILNISAFEPDSPFTIFDSPDKENNPHIDLLVRLSERQMYPIPKREASALRAGIIRAHIEATRAAGPQDIVLATPTQVLHLLLQPKDPQRPCAIQEQLEQSVKRIIIYGVEKVSEAELNCLALLFAKPGVKFVGVGDPGRIASPISDVAHQLQGVSALELMMRKRNLPTIKLHHIFTPEEIRNGWQEELVRGIASFFPGALTNRVYVSVLASQAIPSGRSWINDEEMGALEMVVRRLRSAGYDHQSVLVLAYYEAQQALVKTRLPLEYEVLMVDEAKGREREVVIVLTTAHSPATASAYFQDRARLNLAITRHTEALIVLGSSALLAAAPWQDLVEEHRFSLIEAVRN